VNIRSVRLRAFRCFADARIDRLARVTVFAGLNGTGKSTVADAIAVALTGTCRGAESGRGLDELRRVGSRNKWAVEIETDRGVLTRTEGEGPGSRAQQRVAELTGLGPDAIRACLYSGELMRLVPKDRQRLVLDLARPAPITVPEDVRALALDHITHVLTSTIDRDTLDRLYQAAYALRRERGSEARGAGDAIAAPTPPDPALAGRSVDELISMRTTLVGAVRDLETQHAQDARAVQQAEADALEAVSRLATAQAELARLGPAADGTAIATRASAILADTNRLRAERKHLVQAVDVANTAFATARAMADETAATLTRLRGLGRQCPHCRQAIPSDAAAAMLKTVSREAEAAARLLTRNHEALREARRELDVNEAEIVTARKAAAEVEGAERDFERAAQQREALTREVASLAGAATPPDLGQLRADVATLSARLDTGRLRLAALTEYLGARRAVEQHEARRQSLERQHGDLDRLVKSLDELRGQATGGKLDAFLDTMTATLAALGLDDVDLRPLVDRADDPIVRGHPARMLSRVQSIELGVAFQLAAASITQLGLVMIDDFDALDHVQARAVGRLVEATPHQVVLCQALTSRRPGEDAVAVYRREFVDARNQRPGVRYVLVSTTAAGSVLVAPGANVQQAAS